MACAYIGARGGSCKRKPAPESDFCLLHNVEDEEDDVTNEFINTILANPHVQQGVNKVNNILDKFSVIVDQASKGELPAFKPKPPAAPKTDPALAARALMHFSATEPLTEAIIKDRRKHLARIAHPDTAGGSTDAMARINRATEILIASLTSKPPK